jgi:hypothetical protein
VPIHGWKGTGRRRFGAEDFGGVFAGIADELELVVGAGFVRVDLRFQRRAVLADVRC